MIQRRPTTPSLKVQALLPLALYLAVWAAYATLLQTTIGWGPGAIFGFFCALVLLVLVGLLVAAWRSRRSWQLLEASRLRAPRQNGLAIFEGQLEAVGTPVEAPLSGKPCVAWEYAFETSALDKSGKVADEGAFEWFGIGQVALQVVTPYAKIPIRAGALVENSVHERIARAVGVKRAQRLCELPNLRVVSGAADFGSLLDSLDELMTDDDGDARLDYVRGPWSPGLATGKPKQMREKTLEPGGTVTVRGMYNPLEGAVVASRHGVLIAPVIGSSSGRASAPNFRAEITIILFVLAINIVFHALVVLALVRPPDF